MVMRVVTFKIDEELLEKLDRYARRYGISRSDAIRKAIERLVTSENYSYVSVTKIRIY